MKKFNFKNLILVSIFALAFLPSVSFASAVSFSAPKNDFAQGEQFYVDINLSDVAESVNALEFSVSYPKNILKFVGFLNDNSIINNFIETPHEENGNIVFSGIIPGGFVKIIDPLNDSVKPATVTRLVFEPVRVGDGEINFVGASILLNDGLGTPDEVASAPFVFHVNSSYVRNVIIQPTAPAPKPSDYTAILILIVVLIIVLVLSRKILKKRKNSQ